MSDLKIDVAEATVRVLGAHRYLAVNAATRTGCRGCRWTFPTAQGEAGRRAHEAHVAKEVAAELSNADLIARAKRPSDERWDTAIDWLMNHGGNYDRAPLVFAYTDGLITEKELRDEVISKATIERREERAEEIKRGKPQGPSLDVVVPLIDGGTSC